MPKAFLSLLLSAQIFLSTAPFPQHALQPTCAAAKETRLWWGLIDPELSTWFALLPSAEVPEDKPILWDWSWRGFLAALFGMPMAKEASADAVTA